MKIKELNNREDILIKRYQETSLKSMIKSIKTKGINNSALVEHRKVIKPLSKEMTKSGIGLGLKWLNSADSNQD